MRDVYLVRDIPAIVMYCVYGESGSSLLIESIDSMIGEYLYAVSLKVLLSLSQPRMDEAETVPSKVLHFRNLPESVRENEVAGLALPFGRVANILLLRQKNQTLLEMEDVSSATALISYYSQLPATLRSEILCVKYVCALTYMLMHV